MSCNGLKPGPTLRFFFTQPSPDHDVCRTRLYLRAPLAVGRNDTYGRSAPYEKQREFRFSKKKKKKSLSTNLT